MRKLNRGEDDGAFFEPKKGFSPISGKCPFVGIGNYFPKDCIDKRLHCSSRRVDGHIVPRVEYMSAYKDISEKNV